MGVRDPASVFQKCLSRTLVECRNCISFVDDIWVFGTSKAEHDTALKAMLTALDEKSLRLNSAK